MKLLHIEQLKEELHLLMEGNEVGLHVLVVQLQLQDPVSACLPVLAPQTEISALRAEMEEEEERYERRMLATRRRQETEAAEVSLSLMCCSCHSMSVGADGYTQELMNATKRHEGASVQPTAHSLST